MLSIEAVQYLVFSGGGQRGFAYVGALRELRKRGLDTSDLKGVAGTSIGALIATLLTAGYNSEELAIEVLTIPLEQLLNLNITSFFFQFGLDNGNLFTTYIDSLLQRKTGVPSITFAQLEAFSHKRLVVVTHDLHDDKPVYVSAATHPDLPVVRGLFMSMCVPLLFTPQHLAGHLVVDGGCVENFPMALFPPECTLGFRLHWTRPAQLDTVQAYFGRLAYCALNRADNAQWQEMNPLYRQNTINLEVEDVNTLHWDLTIQQKHLLFACGTEAVRTALDASGHMTRFVDSEVSRVIKEASAWQLMGANEAFVYVPTCQSDIEQALGDKGHNSIKWHNPNILHLSFPSNPKGK